MFEEKYNVLSMWEQYSFEGKITVKGENCCVCGGVYLTKKSIQTEP